MTQKQIEKLSYGTKVRWTRPGEEQMVGYVVDLRKSKPRAEPPLVYVQWPDGQRTDSSDDWAMKHVSRDLSLEMARA